MSTTFRTESAGTKSLEERAREYVDGGENGTNLTAAKDLHDRKKRGTPAEPGPVTTNSVFDTIETNSAIADMVNDRSPTSTGGRAPEPQRKAGEAGQGIHDEPDDDDEDSVDVKAARVAAEKKKVDAWKQTPPPMVRRRASKDRR